MTTKNTPQSIDTTQAPAPVGAYPHARKVGNLLFLSGIGPRAAGKQTNIIPGLEIDARGNFVQFDFAAQVHAVFANVRTVLEAAGSRWENLVDITVFLVNMQRDFNTFNTIYAEYFPENGPCRTTVAISSLPTPIAIELKCIATLGD
ncbi:MAG: Rid family hydrolase [Chitinophagales bacterium]|nr:RidA family protein [Bacteroidota bacterium]MCB9043526.1 RidA family protein [Chitinophagales bacterium]